MVGRHPEQVAAVPSPPSPLPPGPAELDPLIDQAHRRTRIERRGAAAALHNHLVLIAVAVAVLGVGGTAVAMGAPPRPSLALTSAPISTGESSVPLAFPSRLAGHGSTVLATRHGARTVTYDRGIVGGLTYGAIVVTRPDGSTATLAITGGAAFRPRGRHPNVGDGVQVLSDGGQALVITSRAGS
jgi:hypothetical protein